MSGNNPAPIERDYLSPAALSEMFDIHYTTVLNLIRRGDLYAFRVGNTWRIPKAAIEAMVRNEPYNPSLDPLPSKEFQELSKTPAKNRHRAPFSAMRQPDNEGAPVGPGAPIDPRLNVGVAPELPQRGIMGDENQGTSAEDAHVYFDERTGDWGNRAQRNTLDDIDDWG